MTSSLLQHITRFIKVNEDDIPDILNFFQQQEIKKKENLLTEGSVCHSNYFVVKGLLRMFFINEKGIEQTIQFAMENWWMSDYSSFESHKPAAFTIQAVEKTELLSITHDAQEEMLSRFPWMERYFRMVHQRAHAASQFRMRSMYALSREELYYQFNTRYPEFVQRVPQYLLASFLGFTPEYLSEIRSKKRS